MYLRGFARESEPQPATQLERAASAYDELVQQLSVGLEHVPGSNDDPHVWSDDMRHAQADALEAAVERERAAVEALRTVVALLESSSVRREG